MTSLRPLAGLALLARAAFAQAPCQPYEPATLLAHAAEFRVAYWKTRVETCGVSGAWSDSFELGLRRALAKRGELPQRETDKWVEFVKQHTRPPAAPARTLGALREVDGIAMRWIPPGRFTMGCSPGDSVCEGPSAQDWAKYEHPRHEVEITKGYWMAETETTVDHWQRVRKQMPVEINFEGKNLNPGWRNGRYPVVNVTWDEARGFCADIGGRLPTEAEWEYAARAGSTAPVYGPLDGIAWYGNNSGAPFDALAFWREVKFDGTKYRQKLRDNGNRMHDVGGLPPNAWGLKDMIGNVLEWTADWYEEKYYDRKERVNPKGPATGTQRVVRGGSWFYDEQYSRVSYRDWGAPAVRYSSIGVRCVWD